MTRSLVVKATAGADAPERCSQAFTVAATAAAAGIQTSLWLTGEAAWFAVPGGAEQFHVEHAEPLPSLMAEVLREGSITVCSQCAARRGISPADVIPGITVAGSASYVAEVMEPDAQALVY